MDTATANRRESNGSFGWDGAFGTHFWPIARGTAGRVAEWHGESNGPLMRDFRKTPFAQAIVE
jgi:hypothetical protein